MHVRRLALALLLWALAAPGRAEPLGAGLAGLSFLVGDWSSTDGAVPDTGGTAAGTSHFTVAANGGVLVRQDRTHLFDKAGRPSGDFDQIMIIYPEAGTLHADYSDGGHVIHYTQADVVPGRSVTFSSARQPGAPVFQLTYRLTAPGALAVAFGMVQPGAAALTPIATGTLRKNR